MKKQTIKLNESQLRKIIKEALNELDWKTYQNAARKANLKGKIRQRDAFMQAAADRFNDTYGYNDSEDHYGSDYYAGSTSKKYEMQPSLYYPITTLTKKHSWSDKPEVYSYHPSSNEEFPLGAFRKGYDSDIEYGNANPKFQFGGDEPGRGFMAHKAALHGHVVGPSIIDKGNKELYDYENGKYDYTPEKGWHLKESKLNKIIKESIKKVLKESTNNPIILGDESDGYLWYVEIGDGGYESTIFNIYAQNEQDALDSAVDYCEQQGWNGLFWDDDEEVTKYEDDFITAGNSGHYLRIDCFIVRRM